MIVSVIGVILLENRNPLNSLTWILILILLPVIGLILYFF
ncbi:MAG TPA: PLDc N-terminal domain-containing protein, partial [Paludibacteraceae bacterium]|nr:PLDc N-terminal domain-containing protein [Paludibacteraceae bacterium]